MNHRFDHGYALLIGVGASAYAPWSLPVTVKDVQALRDILTDPALCGYPADHIRLLHDGGAIRQVILDHLARLAGQAVADRPLPRRGHGGLSGAANAQGEGIADRRGGKLRKGRLPPILTA